MNSSNSANNSSAFLCKASPEQPGCQVMPDEQKAATQQSCCPDAPLLRPRNMSASGKLDSNNPLLGSDLESFVRATSLFKFNSSKCFLQEENIIEYTPFFYSEGSDGSSTESDEECSEFMKTSDTSKY